MEFEQFKSINKALQDMADRQRAITEAFIKNTIQIPESIWDQVNTIDLAKVFADIGPRGDSITNITSALDKISEATLVIATRMNEQLTNNWKLIKEYIEKEETE
jgi:hypothetical protein